MGKSGVSFLTGYVVGKIIETLYPYVPFVLPLLHFMLINISNFMRNVPPFANTSRQIRICMHIVESYNTHLHNMTFYHLILLLPFHRFHGTTDTKRRACSHIPTLHRDKHMCQGLNSHYLHIIEDGHQPNSRGLYTHYMDSLIKGGRFPIPKKTRQP